jgi:glutamyl endopeptidase
MSNYNPETTVTHKCTGNIKEFDFRSITPKFYILDENEKLLPPGVESVCNTDERIQVQSATSLPYKAICKLYIRSSTGKNFVGSGWLTHSNKLYTAGHCVYDHGEGGWMDSIIVIPGKSGSSEPYGRYTAADMLATNGWTNDASERYDMGAILLTSNVSHGDFLSPTLTDADSGTVCGYPADRDGGDYQYRMLDTVGNRDGRFYYQIDTAGGQSGCPLLKNNSTSMGIHNYGGCDNKASDLYQGFIDDVNKW